MELDGVMMKTKMGKFRETEPHEFDLTSLRKPSIENQLEKDELDGILDVLAYHLMCVYTGGPCYRNDSAVDMSIALWCMGYSEPWLWVSQLCDLVGLPKVSKEFWQEHFERVYPYLERWGEIGTDEATAYFV